MSEKHMDPEAGPRQLEDADGLTSHQRGNIDPAIEKRVVRKLDLNLMPLVIALYLMSALDRGNIGNAETAGMSKSLHMSSAQFTWLLTVFYIPYILFEWLALMWKLIPPHIWGACCVLLWGVVASVQSATQNWAGMMVCRVFLAIGEAGYGPGIPFLLSFFYMRHELGLRTGIFLAAAPFATCFAGALAYGITSGHPGLASWRVLFLVEGLPTVALAVVVFFFLPDSPAKARFLNEEERRTTTARAIRQAGEEPERRVGSVNLKEVFQAITDIKTWIISLMFFSCNVSFASLPVFLPSILVGMGYSSIHAQGLTAPPYFLSGCICIISTYISDRTRQRGYTIVILSLIGGIGYILIASDYHVGVRYLGVWFAAAGVFPAIANILPWVINNQGTDSKRGAGIALLQMIGQCGPVLGTNIYPKNDAPKYVKGLSTCAGFMFFNAFLALALRTYLARENRKFNRMEEAAAAHAEHAASSSEKFEAIAVENEGIGYRYFL